MLAAARPPDADGDVVRACFLGDGDLQHEEVGRPNRNHLVPREDAELAHQDAVGELREVESGRVAASAAPESPGNGHHGPTLAQPCCRSITGAEHFGDGA